MKTWKLLLTCCISFCSAFFANVAVDIACGPEADPYDAYVSFFHNNLQGEQGYRPFYFTDWNFVYDENEPADERQINAREWAAYLGRPVTAADVEKVMYKLDSASTVRTTQALECKATLPDSLLNNTFLQALALGKHKDANTYYRFAKQVEPLANIACLSWEPVKKDTAALTAAAQQAQAQILTVKDKFIRLRYAYQAQRLFHYGDADADAEKVYDHYTARQSSSSYIKGLALALKAGELHNLGDSVQAAYLFSKVFSQYPEKRLLAYINYTRFSHAGLKQVLPLAKNGEERASLYAMEGFGNPEPGMEYLQHTYENAPASVLNGVLLIREINKMEESYLQKLLTNAQYTTYNVGGKGSHGFFEAVADSEQTKYNTRLQQLIRFCGTLAAEKRYPEPALGHIAASYLYWMQNKTSEGMAELAAIDKSAISTKLNDQRQIVSLLLSAQQIQHYNAVNEAALLPALQWLDRRVATIPAAGYNNQGGETYRLNRFAITARNFYSNILAPAYLRQRDTAKAAAALYKSNFYHIDGYTDVQNATTEPAAASIPDFWYTYLRSSHLKQLISWKTTASGQAYHRFLFAPLKTLTADQLQEMLGTAYLREHNYAYAYQTFKRLPVSYFTTANTDDNGDTYGDDPFVDPVNDYPKQHTTVKQGYSKLTYARAMLQLQQQIKAHPTVAANYYRMASGLYSASTYGNSWELISYYWSAYDFGRSGQYYYDTDYVKTGTAMQYYLKARALSRNPEFKARCTFMAAKCRQKQWNSPEYNYLTDYSNYEKNQAVYRSHIRSSSYFRELGTTYRNTRFVKQAIGECSYLRDYIRVQAKVH
ncbi:hypothetical protein [Mucilaginibacter sp.]